MINLFINLDEIIDLIISGVILTKKEIIISIFRLSL